MWRLRQQLATSGWQSVPEQSHDRMREGPCAEEGAGTVPVSALQPDPARPVEVAGHRTGRGKDGDYLRNLAARHAGAGSTAEGTAGLGGHREGLKPQRTDHR